MANHWLAIAVKGLKWKEWSKRASKVGIWQTKERDVKCKGRWAGYKVDRTRQKQHLFIYPPGNGVMLTHLAPMMSFFARSIPAMTLTRSTLVSFWRKKNIKSLIILPNYGNQHEKCLTRFPHWHALCENFTWVTTALKMWKITHKISEKTLVMKKISVNLFS